MSAWVSSQHHKGGLHSDPPTLRIRLKKIEKFVHTLDVDKCGDTFSKEEQAFARNYKTTLEVSIYRRIRNIEKE